MLIRASLVLAFSVVGLAASASAQFVRVSVSTAGAEGDGASRAPSVSANGRFVAFQSAAANLVTGDTNGRSDIFLRDRDTDGDLVFDEPGAVSTTRVSVGPGGVESNGVSNSPLLSQDGRYLFFVSSATNLTTPGVVATTPQIYHRNLTTGETTLVSATALGEPARDGCDLPDISGDGRYVVFRCQGAALVPGDAGYGGSIYLRDMTTGVLTRLSEPQPAPVGTPPAYGAAVYYVASPSISHDGQTLAFVEGVTSWIGALTDRIVHGTVTTIDRAAGVTRRAVVSGVHVAVAGDGRAFFAFEQAAQFDRPTRLVQHSMLTPSSIYTRIFGTSIADVSADGRHVLVSTVPQTPPSEQLYDARFGMAFMLPYSPIDGSFDGEGRSLAFTSDNADVPIAGGDHNLVADVYLVDLDALFDQDGDTLDDRAETFYGLSPAVASGADGPGGDPDGDGLTNAVEVAAGTHPRGFVKRYLAEGAASSFFRTRYMFANPDLDPSHEAAVVISFLRDRGVPVRAAFRVWPGTRRDLDAASVAGLEMVSFSAIVESDRPVAVDRTMSWDTRSPFQQDSGYGAHTESAAEAPSTEWYLAEGATGMFDLFYSLQNPQDTAVDVTVRYLTPSGTPLVRSYPVPARSRRTIRVNDVDATLAWNDVSAAFSATAPIVVERAMYASRPGQPFALGHAARGVTTPATNWFLAEGATGGFFDTYVLIANPTAGPAEIEARFDRPDGGSVTRTYSVAANSRFTIQLDSIPGLEWTSVATTIRSTNATPVIVERAMYWPGGFANYYEGHSSAGSTTTGLRWVLAEGHEASNAGVPTAQTYVLIANTGSTPGRARITKLYGLGAGQAGAIEVDLPPNSRTSVRPGGPADGRFGVLVESIGATPAPIVVEGAFYWTVGGVLWAAGSNVLATPIP